MRLKLQIFLNSQLVWLLVFIPPAFADLLIDEARLLARMGATDMALEVLDRESLDWQVQTGSWMDREQVRLEILSQAERWDDVAERAALIPIELPVEFVLWGRTQQATAQLALTQSQAARDTLRPLIWFGSQHAEARWLQTWRRMVIESYEQEERWADALSALAFYRADYESQEEDLSYWSARLSFASGDYVAAAAELSRASDARGTALRLMAELLLPGSNAEQIRQQAVRQARAQDAGSADAARALAVAARAAVAGDQLQAQILALEAALATQRYLDSDDQAFQIPSQRLWEAYQRLGAQQSNERQLLLGEDEAWLRLVTSLSASDAVTARALLVQMAMRSPNPAGRDQAHDGFVRLLLDSVGGGGEVLNRLYLSGTVYGSPQRVPHGARHLLAQRLLEAGDLATAASLMLHVQTPPASVDAFDWGLRRARALILGGYEEAGIDGLYDVLAETPVLDEARGERFLQVMFDLQTVGRDQEAINLFQALAPRLESSRQRRELWFWMADSYRALEEHALAARLYLRSALAGDSTDLWGLSARFQAAEALAKAGYLNDAASLYRDLLRRTDDPGRRLVLGQKLQELLLR